MDHPNSQGRSPFLNRSHRFTPAGALASHTGWQEVDDSVPDKDGTPYAFSQIAAPSVAQAWIDEAARLTSPEMEAHLMGKDGQLDQEQVTQDAWVALSKVYTALNLPPSGDATFRAIAETYDKVDQSRLEAIGRAHGIVNDTDAKPSTICFKRRYFLAPDATVLSNFQRRNPPQVPASSDDNVGYTAPGYAPEFPAPPYFVTYWPVPGRAVGAGISGADWTKVQYASHDSAREWIEGYGNQHREDMSWCASYFLAPTYWSFEEARDIAQSMKQRGALAVLRQIRLDILATNVTEAIWAGLINDQNDPGGALREAAANAKAYANSTQVLSSTKEGQAVIAGIGIVAAVVVAIPVYGQIVAAILAAVAAVIAVLPMPKFIHTDRWGRPRPVFEPNYLSNGGDGYPTYAPPSLPKGVSAPPPRNALQLPSVVANLHLNPAAIGAGQRAALTTKPAPTLTSTLRKYKTPLLVGAGASLLFTGVYLLARRK